MFLGGKTEKLKIAVLAFFKQENCYNKMKNLSENITFQNLLKNRKLLPAEKFGNILTFDKESKRKSNHLYQQTDLLKII